MVRKIVSYMRTIGATGALIQISLDGHQLLSTEAGTVRRHAGLKPGYAGALRSQVQAVEGQGGMPGRRRPESHRWSRMGLLSARRSAI